MGEIHIERYEIDGEREIDPGELLVLYVVLEVEYAEELLGECAALAGLYSGLSFIANRQYMPKSITATPMTKKRRM